MNPNFWRGKRVFLTGHTGFKGSWLSLWLQSLDVELTGYALAAPTNPSLFEAANVAVGMKSIVGDIRDYQALQQALKETQPEIVIHFAAQSLVRHSYDYPIETYATNVMGTVHLLEAIRHTPSVRAVLNITTDKCYENKEWMWGYRENEPMGGFDPYSNSKGCAELVTSAYRSSYFNPAHFSSHGVALASARAGNVIGGGDWAKDRLIPDMIRAFSVNEPVKIRHPHAIRPWQHVLEPLHAYLKLAEKLYTNGIEFAQAWNFGPEDADAKPVEWIVQKLSQLWGDSANWELDQSAQPHEANYLKLDISKAKQLLNWQPMMRLEQALEMIVAWVKETQQHQHYREATLAQIKSYQTFIKN